MCQILLCTCILPPQTLKNTDLFMHSNGRKMPKATLGKSSENYWIKTSQEMYKKLKHQREMIWNWKTKIL